MTRRQANWASAHDWFIRAKLLPTGEWSVLVREDIPGDGNQWFTNYHTLRAYAGY